MVRPTYGSGLYGCCGARKPPGERNNYCPPCKREYMRVWRKAHHKRGDPYYERLLANSRRAGRERTRSNREDREWRGRRVRNAIAALNASGVDCRAIRSALGVSEMSVYDWRGGKRVPTARNADRLFRFAAAVGIAA